MWNDRGKAIPPPKDRQPSQGNYKEMQEGVMRQVNQQQDDGLNQTNDAEDYVNELIEKASAVSYKLFPRAPR